MASYKDIITGTLNNIAGKVKEAAESGAIRDIYEHGASRAKSYGQIAKLSLEINGDSEELKKVYAEIGRLYYDQAKEAPEGYFAPLFEQAGSLIAGINDKQAQIQAMKEEFEAENAPAVDADFESVVDETEDDGTGVDPEDGIEIEIIEEPADESGTTED
ncbi:MAG: hypothetical protein PUB77_06960 [Clostridiales bacterium]|nr:hypothetical protein [Clostridiales bacterium]